MGSVYARGTRLYVGFKDAGKWRYKATGLAVGDEARAEQLLTQIEAQQAAERHYAAGEASSGPVTLAGFAERWLKDREAIGIRDAGNDLGRLRKHVLPLLRHLPLAAIRPHHVRELVRTWRANAIMAPRTLRNVYGVLHTLFRDAIIDELVQSTPCVLSTRELGPKEDKNPEWRAGALYDRHEVVELICSATIPLERRVAYAILALAGLRHGEMAGLRWRNYDPTREPLGKLVIARSYDNLTTKTKRPREVPVHPALATILKEWRAHGFAELIGRAPQRDDLLIPSRRGELRDRHHSRKQLLADLERLGFRVRRGHDLRRTFVTLARADGARADLLEMITHAPRGDIINIYTSMPWASLCEEVAKLRIEKATVTGPSQQVATVAAAPLVAHHFQHVGSDSVGALKGCEGATRNDHGGRGRRARVLD
jgi:integrase